MFIADRVYSCNYHIYIQLKSNFAPLSSKKNPGQKIFASIRCKIDQFESTLLTTTWNNHPFNYQRFTWRHLHIIRITTLGCWVVILLRRNITRTCHKWVQLCWWLQCYCWNCNTIKGETYSHGFCLEIWLCHIMQYRDRDWMTLTIDSNIICTYLMQCLLYINELNPCILMFPCFQLRPTIRCYVYDHCGGDNRLCKCCCYPIISIVWKLIAWAPGYLFWRIRMDAFLEEQRYLRLLIERTIRAFQFKIVTHLVLLISDCLYFGS